jgi:hypothetical protein
LLGTINVLGIVGIGFNQEYDTGNKNTSRPKTLQTAYLEGLLLIILPIQGLSPLTRSEVKGIVVSISFLDAQCPVFQWDDKSMFATAGVHEAASLHYYAISFGILVFLPPFFLCSVVFYIFTSYFISQLNTRHRSLENRISITS